MTLNELFQIYHFPWSPWYAPTEVRHLFLRLLAEIAGVIGLGSIPASQIPKNIHTCPGSHGWCWRSSGSCTAWYSLQERLGHLCNYHLHFQARNLYSSHYWRVLWNETKHARFFKSLLSRFTEAVSTLVGGFAFPRHFFQLEFLRTFPPLASANRSWLFHRSFSTKGHLSISISTKPSLDIKYWSHVTGLFSKTGEPANYTP